MIYFILLAMAAVLGHTIFGASIECVSSITRAFELLFLLLIGATSFTEFVPRGYAENKIDTFFQIFYCGFIPIIFQWILFEFFLAILGDALGEEKEILQGIEATGDTLPNDLRKLVEYKLFTVRKEWPRFEEVHDLLKSAIQLHEKQHPSNEEDYLEMLDRSDVIKEDDYEVNLETVTHLAKKIMEKDPFYVGRLKHQPDYFVEYLLQNKPKFDDVHEVLNRKREKIRSMKLDMYCKLQKCADEVKDDMETYFRHKQILVNRSENSAVRWKRIKELAEDIEIALEDVTKETFDKQKVKAKVRELQSKRREVKREYEKKWREAIEKVKRYRCAPARLVFDATSTLVNSSKGFKTRQALKAKKIYSKPHGSKSSNRRHREQQKEDSRIAEAELNALQSFQKMDHF